MNVWLWELLAKLNKISGARIVAGEEYLDKLKNEKGIIIVTNHFGIAKLTRIDNSEDRFPIPIHLFLIQFALLRQLYGGRRVKKTE